MHLIATTTTKKHTQNSVKIIKRQNRIDEKNTIIINDKSNHKHSTNTYKYIYIYNQIYIYKKMTYNVYTLFI